MWLSRLLKQTWRERGRACGALHPCSERVVHLCGECGLQQKAGIIRRYHGGNKGILQIRSFTSRVGTWTPGSGRKLFLTGRSYGAD